MRRVLKRALKREGAKAPSSFPGMRGTIEGIEASVKGWMLGARVLRVQPVVEKENDFIESHVHSTEMIMVNKAVMPYNGINVNEYLPEYVAALQKFGISKYVNRFTTKEDLSQLVDLIIQSLFDEEDRNIRIGFNDQFGVYVFNARVGEELQVGIDLSLFWKTRFFDVVVCIAKRVISENIMHDTWNEYSDHTAEYLFGELDYAIKEKDQDAIEYNRAALNEDWNQKWFAKFMKETLYAKPKLSMKEHIDRLRLPTAVRNELVQLNEMLDDYKTSFLPYIKYFEGSHLDFDESFNDSALHPVYWGRNSDFLLDQMGSHIDSIHGECWVSEYSNIVGIENGKVYIDKIGSRAYSARYNIRKTVLSCVNSLSLLMTEKQRSRNGLPTTS